MNWYLKIISSSHNLKFPEGMEEQINSFINQCVEYFFSKQDKPIYGGTFNYINPYTNQQDSINSIIFPSSPSGFEKTIALFNPQKKSISVFPYNHNINDINPSVLFNYLKPYIYHEISHAIDPKFLIKDWWKNRKNIDYLLREEEFDAYSKQIEYIIQNNINKTNIDNLETWLKTNDIDTIPDYLQNHKNKIQYWQENKPIYIRKLKQRIYNSFIGGIENDI